MASTSGCSHELKDLQLSNTSFMIRDSSKKFDFTTSTSAHGVDHAILSTSYFSTLEEQIEQSKAHWSTLADISGCEDEEEVDFKVSNEQEFLALQRHPTWGGFFANFSGDGVSTGFNFGVLGEVAVGKKFAEGGQAELYDVRIKWINSRDIEQDERFNDQYVLKVFKEETLLKHVKYQLPQGLLQNHVDFEKHMMSPTPNEFPQYVSRIHFGILLKSGRFAFLMTKEQFDLRTLIERNMELRTGADCGPFSKEEGEGIMYDVALGVEWLHNRDIVHRDLKASNILIYENDYGCLRRDCYVADYECSIGVVGTNFFRAPEILQVCKERKANKRPEVFSREADVYAYGMTCYEILTGRLPFEDHPLSDTPSLLIDLVINQHLRPEVPQYVEEWTRKLLYGCWQFDPTARPRIGEILNVLSTNSGEIRRREVYLKERFGESYR